MKLNRRNFIKTIVISIGAVNISKLIEALGKTEVFQIVEEPELGIYNGFTIYNEFALNPYQEEMLKWIEDTEHKRIIFSGGRHCGKTYMQTLWKENYCNSLLTQSRVPFKRKIPRPNSRRNSKRI